MNRNQNSTTKPQVVIIGGGFGGLYTAQGLKNSPVDIKLIDKRNFHFCYLENRLVTKWGH